MANETKVDFRETSTEANVYADVYRVLVGGMIVSTILFVIGVVRALMHPTFFPLTADWVRQHYQFSTVMHGLAALDPMTLMMVATILLILTPVARVIVSIWAFMVDRDYKFVAITSIVFLIMVITVIAGLLGLH
jgi:uncharacterized membrane protein